MQGEAPQNFPQGLKPVPFPSAFCGTTEVVPFQEMGHTRVVPQPVQPLEGFARKAGKSGLVAQEFFILAEKPESPGRCLQGKARYIARVRIELPCSFPARPPIPPHAPAGR